LTGTILTLCVHLLCERDRFAIGVKPADLGTLMTEGDDGKPRSAYQPGEAVWVFVLGTWQPAVVVGTEEGGYVLAQYRRLDGSLAERTFSPSSVVEADALGRP
jgi:hypothetical protein